MRSSSAALWLGPLASIVLVPAIAVVACSDDSPENAADAGEIGHDHPTDRGSTTSSSGGGGDDDAEPAAIRCTEEELAAIDRTSPDADAGVTDAGSFDIVFATGANPAQYTNRCQTVKVGTTVVFRGSFAQHPLEPAGGDSPSPIPFTDANTSDGTLSVTMTAPGTFGYQCLFHPTLMFGAIKVVP